MRLRLSRLVALTLLSFPITSFAAWVPIINDGITIIMWVSESEDTDGDGLPDDWELSNGFKPDDPSDGNADLDNDGLTNGEEYAAGTDMNNSDSDGDGIPDGWEVAHNLNPLLANDASQDTDGDGISNLDEYLAGTNPNLPDIDFANQTPAAAPVVPQVDIDESAHVGSIQGAFRVNESGAATYTIPIVTPEGTAGVKPEVSLTYNSQSGNGVMGLGWNIGGLSAITRCRQTLGQDGTAKAITLTDEDQYCLNGNRLLLISGTHGSIGATYSTELNQFVTVTKVSRGGYVGFEVAAKDGSKSYFGTSADSQLQLGSNVFTWARSEFLDSASNVIQYEYINDSTGQYLSEIKYAYGASETTPNAEIKFNYSSSRSDPIYGYVAGFETTVQRKLDSIEVSNNGSVVRTYTINYKDVSGAANKFSRVDNIEECASGVCLPPTSFDWTESNDGFEATPQQITLNTQNDRHVVSQTPADINGDGRLDIVWLVADYTESGGDPEIDYHVLFASIADENNNFGPVQQVFQNSNNTGTPFKIQSLDYNADGRADIALYNNAHWKIILSTPQGENTWRLSQVINSNITDKHAYFLDINSDGLADAVSLRINDNNNTATLYSRLLEIDPAQNTSSNRYYRFSTQENTLYSLPGPHGTYNKYDIVPAEFNGDGQSDIAVLRETPFMDCEEDPYNPDCGAPIPIASTVYAIKVDSGVGSNYGTASGNVYFLDNNSRKAYVEDFNKDGLSDIFISPYAVSSYNDQQHYALFLNTGQGFSSTIGDIAVNPMAIVDPNYDGYPDILAEPAWDYGGGFTALLWDPATNQFDTQTTAVRDVPSDQEDDGHLFADFSGDNLTDYIHISKDLFEIYHGTGTGHRNKITSITNGLDAVTEVTYETMRLSTHYQRLTIGTMTQEFEWGGQSYTYTNADSGAFYEAINGGWDLPGDSQTLGKYKPVLELAGPIFVVTDVESSAPEAGTNPGSANSSATSSISYVYGEAKIQASGRGFLGFHKIKTIDNQGGVETTTTYRQDFPFIGMPQQTEVRSSAGNLLSRATNTWKLVGWQNTWPGIAENQGTKALGPLQAYLAKSVEETYDLVDNGGSPGSLIKKVVTQQGDYAADGTVLEPAYDQYGNALYIKTETEDGDGNIVQTSITDNTYSDDPWERRMGRLERTDVTVSRGSDDHTRSSAFVYYDPSGSDPECVSSEVHKGLLCKEITEPDDEEYRLTTTHQYDSFGNINYTVTSGEGVVPRYSQADYDSIGRYVTRTYNSLGHKTREVIARNDLGQPTITEGINGVRTYNNYDPFGGKYLTYSETGAHSITLASPCPSGGCSGVLGSVFKVAEQSSGSNLPNTIQYFDVLARPIRESTLQFDGTYSHVDFEYDDRGRLRYVSEPYESSAQYWTATNYDLLDRPVYTLLPDSSDVTVDYSGLSVTTTNNLGQSKTETKNVLGELIQVTDNIGPVIKYDYDTQGNLRYVHSLGNGDVATSTIQMCYDDLGRKTAMRDPDKGGYVSGASNTCPTDTEVANPGWWVYNYNTFGELTSQIDAKGQEVVMTYDQLGRMETRVDYLANSSVEGDTTWEYDTAANGLGLLESVSDSVSGYSEIYTYDSFSRPERTFTELDNSGNNSYVSEVYYDRYSRVITELDVLNIITGNSGLSYFYNQYGFKQAVTDLATGDLIQEIQQTNTRGQVTEELRGNGVTSSYAYYNDTGRLERQRADLAGVFSIQFIEYQWDTLGNLDSRHNTSALPDQSGTKDLLESFEYDDLNRLESSTVNGTTSTFTYYSNGNIDTKTGVGTYTYGDNAGPHAVTGTGDGVSYYYDNNGNMTGDNSGRSLNHTTFDKPDQIVKGGHTTSFKYAPDRSRYLRIDDDSSGTITTTQYLGNIERVSKSNTSTVEWKRYLNGVAIYTVTTDQNDVTQSTEKAYLYKDHLGSMDVITDVVGNVIQSMSFDPWGQRRDPVDWSQYTVGQLLNFTSDITTRGFTGHEMLDEVGLIHMNGRVYDPKLGRFVQGDPYIDGANTTQGYNRYSYIHNNPLNGIDPTGYMSWTEFRDGVLKPVVFMAVLGPYGGAAAIAAETYRQTGNVGMAIIAGSTAYVSRAAFGSIGNANASIYYKALAHGVVGGVMSMFQGGKFGHGFVSAGFTKLMTPYITGLEYLEIGGKYIDQAIAAAVIGGTISELTGGKFANGAVTAAFGNIFNQQSSSTNKKVKIKFNLGSKDLEKFLEAFSEYNVEELFQEVLPEGEYEINVSFDDTIDGYMSAPNKNTILVNPNNFEDSTLAYIAGAIGHELIHIDDHIRIGLSTDAKRYKSEVRAYKWQHGNSKHFDYSIDQKIWLLNQVKKYQLHYDESRLR